MAKLSTSTYLDLTQVQDLGATARYDFDNRRGDLPLAGQLAQIDGFANSGNNVDAFLVSITSTQPGYFIVGKTTQTNETLSADAVIKRIAGCSPIPKPPKTSAVMKGNVMTKCIFRARSNKPKSGAKSRTMIWTPIMGMSVFHLTKQNLRLMARHWKKVLTAGQRTTWNNWAAGATIYAYDGTVKTPTGFQAYIRVVKAQNFLYFNPYGVNGKPWVTIFPIPPHHAWTDLGAPNVTTLDRFLGGEFGVKFSSIPVSNDLFAMLNIAKLGTDPSRPKSWFAGWNDDAAVDYNNPNFYSFYRSDFPLNAPENNRPMQCCLSYYDAHTYSWGDYTYFVV